MTTPRFSISQFCTPDVPLAVYVDGQRQEGNPADIVLGDQLEIAIVIGTPPEEIPDSYRQDEASAQTQAADYIAGMTDRFALATHDRLFRPTLNL